MLNNIKNDWYNLLKNEANKDYFTQLDSFLTMAYKERNIFPEKNMIFNALNLTAYQDVKVVILGQDPYHGPNQAHGLSFSVQKDVKIPPSLRNIYKELVSDINCPPPIHGDLTKWAEEGVLLLNTVLTVESGKANSHSTKGWEHFTHQIINVLNEHPNPIIYILWGTSAQKKIDFIDTEKHFIIKSVHPSPLSSYRGFFDSKPFSRTNEILRNLNQKEIDWSL